MKHALCGQFQSHLPALGVAVQIRSGSLPGGREPCRRRGGLVDDLMLFFYIYHEIYFVIFLSHQRNTTRLDGNWEY